MPLGESERWEKTYSKFCGLETDFSDDVPSLLSFNIDNGRFDFVVAPLINPSYRPSLVDERDSDSHVLPFAGSDLVVSPLKWRLRVIGKISSWIDLDSEDETLRMNSETALKQEIAWAKHLSLRACLLPTPKGTSCANYARCVNQILQGKLEMEVIFLLSFTRTSLHQSLIFLLRSHSAMKLWLRIPLRKSNSEYPIDSWEIWNSLRLLCDHDSKLSVALDVGSTLPLPSKNSRGRWLGESVKAAIISTDCFVPIDGLPYLQKSHQDLIGSFFHGHAYLGAKGLTRSDSFITFIIISGIPLDDLQTDFGAQKHPHKPYLDYLSNLFEKMEPLSEQERIDFRHRDCLCTPLQPLRDNLEAHSYEMIERDSVKYTQYQRAIAKALVDMVSDEKASELTIVLMVVGAGRGPLVRASLQAAEETGRKLKVYAVEKNPNAVVTLHDLVKTRGWEGTVTVISRDMRFWNAPEKADILVSELLGSFGDNELSPECLDGAQRLLKPNGISIPFSYTSFLQPITSSKLYSDVKSRNNLSYFATAYSVKLHSVARLAPCEPVFTFTHPDLSRKPNNQCYKKLLFNVPSNTGSALVHGFAGYFEAILYDNVHISNEPTTETPNMNGWFPIFFPLMKPLEVHPKSTIEAHFWRCSDSTKVWYEWSVSLPTFSPIHNTNGSSYWIGL
ncbi:unnamed protein product [Thlaspi arvense]|uniref:Protein arginine N-methyltransferase n=1 Tax=Thlaspi arvense TaxID=13288 RepID=A0AAU9SAB2_THLAR|nr:unnamed protein product [Thlaspi arvense]